MAGAIDIIRASVADTVEPYTFSNELIEALLNKPNADEFTVTARLCLMRAAAAAGASSYRLPDGTAIDGRSAAQRWKELAQDQFNVRSQIEGTVAISVEMPWGADQNPPEFPSE